MDNRKYSSVKNILAEYISNSPSIGALVESLDKAGYMTPTIENELLLICFDKDPNLGIEILFEILSIGSVSENLVIAMMRYVYKNYKALFDERNFYKFNKILGKIYSTYENYSQKCLMDLVNFLEYLFAIGFVKLRGNIGSLFKRIYVSNNDIDNAFAIRQQLSVVYQCNRYNFSDIREKIDAVQKHCKHAKLKHLGGMIFYYYAVLEIFEGKNRKTRNDSFIPIDKKLEKKYHFDYLDKSLKRDFPLAKVLLRHYDVVFISIINDLRGFETPKVDKTHINQGFYESKLNENIYINSEENFEGHMTNFQDGKYV